MDTETSDSDLIARVERVFRSIFPPTLAFRPDLDRAQEADWNSLLHVEFLIGLEKEFGIRFDGADATDMSSIPDVVARVRDKLE